MTPKRTTQTRTGRQSQGVTPSHPRELPAWAVAALYALVCVILFHEFILGPGMLLGTDTQATGYFARNFYTEFVRSFHTFPLWDPLLFGGLPFIDAMHGDIFYPPSLALFFMNAAQAWGWKMVLHVFLAGVFMYLWLRELGLRRETAFFGGLVYMMGADLVSLVYPGGDGKLFVSALAPLAFLLTYRAVTRHRISDYALLALGVALMVFTSHMQLAYFAIWGISLYALFLIVQQWRAERNAGKAAALFAAFALAGIVGVGAAAVQFFPPLGYLREYSHRAEKTLAAEGESAYQYSTTYSLHAEEIASLVVPEFVGDNIPHEDGRGATYWGRNPFKYNHEYAGFLPLLLLPLLFLRRRSAQSWFFAGLAILSLLYALGADTPVFRLFYLIPGVKLFRAPSLIIFLYALSIATLGALALERALEWARGPAEDTRAARRYLWIATGVLGVLAFLAASGVLVQIWRAVLYRDLTNVEALSANLPFIAKGFTLTFVVALVVAGLWEGMAREVYGQGTLIALISVLAFMEMYRVDAPFIRATTLINDPNSPLFVADEATQFLQQRQRAGEVFRAADLWVLLGQKIGSNDLAVHGIEQFTGHHGNEIGRYRNLVGGDNAANLGTPEANNCQTLDCWVKSARFQLVDVTNTEYLVAPEPIDDPRFEEVFRGRSALVYRKTGVRPRAYLVGSTEVVSDSNAVQRLLSPAFDYRTTALLPQALPASVEVQPSVQGSVQWVERTANAFRLRVQADRPALLMLLDNYYPMWQATVDGQPVEILRANYTFRAIPVGAGQHEVQLSYVPSNVRGPAIVSAVLLGLLAVLGLGLPLARRFSHRGAPAA